MQLTHAFAVRSAVFKGHHRGHRRHPRHRVDADPLPAGDIRRATRTLGVRRRGRRDPLHRFHFHLQTPGRSRVTARLIVRRARDQNPNHQVPDGQGELFPAWRHHAVFTDTDLPMLTAESDHRRHAIIEQVIADLKNGPLAHLPSGNFAANFAWQVLAAIAFNLTRAVGALASVFHAKAATATIRAQLIGVAGRVVRSARRSARRLPTNSPRATAWQQLFTAAMGRRSRSEPDRQPRQARNRNTPWTSRTSLADQRCPTARTPGPRSTSPRIR
jgi:hypothetical protein